MKKEIKYTEFIATESFDEDSGRWEVVCEENGYDYVGENWLSDESWTSNLIYIQYLTKDIIIVGYYKNDTDKSVIYLYKGILK